MCKYSVKFYESGLKMCEQLIFTKYKYLCTPFPHRAIQHNYLCITQPNIQNVLDIFSIINSTVSLYSLIRLGDG
jgi:hypothetical protein